MSSTDMTIILTNEVQEKIKKLEIKKNCICRISLKQLAGNTGNFITNFPTVIFEPLH